MSYKVIIVPSDADEERFESCSSFEDALKLIDSSEMVSIFDFATEAERNAFITGYESAIGFLGNGLYYIN